MDALESTMPSSHLPWRPCSDCGTLTHPSQLVEVRFPDVAVRWLCWECLHRLFDADEDERS
jgi:hypothetical protein